MIGSQLLGLGRKGLPTPPWTSAASADTHIDSRGISDPCRLPGRGPGEPIRHSVVSGRRGRSAGAGTGIPGRPHVKAPHGRVLFASKSFHPIGDGTGRRRRMQPGCRRARRTAGRRARRVDLSSIVLHGNAKSDAEIAKAIEMRLRYIVVDNLDDVVRIADGLRVGSGPSARQPRHPGRDRREDGHRATRPSSGPQPPSRRRDPQDSQRAVAGLTRTARITSARRSSHRGAVRSKRLPHWRDSSARRPRPGRRLGIRYVSLTPPQASRVRGQTGGAVHRHLGNRRGGCSNRAARWSVRIESRSTGSSL